IRLTHKESLRDVFENTVSSHTDLDEEMLAHFEPIIDDWMRRVDPLFEPRKDTVPFTTQQFRAFADAQLAALKAMYASEAQGSARAKAVQGLSSLVMMSLIEHGEDKGQRSMIEME
ncbi:MAG: hypothetical protein KDB07_02265, partial [Planctomycetes bacterium]|nr:hypothetical protein [Planctomycetota bacterium]